jgi:tetratricopeptide (TPR) repeat protein
MPDDAIQSFTKAVEHHSRGRFAEALTHYGTVIRLNPDMVQAHSNRGAALNSLKRHEQALQSCDRALAIDPAFADAWNNRGNALKGLERIADALHSYDRAIALKPDYPSALNNRGNAFRALNRPEDALRSYDRAIALTPDYADACYNRGIALEDLNRPDEAVQSYNRAIEIQPGFAEAYNARGIALQLLGRLDEAVGSYDTAVRLRPDYAGAWNNRGNALKALKRHEEALQSYERAIALVPDYAEAHYNRGIALADLKRLDDALQAYDRAIALKPDTAEAHSNRGNVLQDLERMDDAIASYDRAIALKPDFAKGWNNRGVVLRDLRRLDEAIASFDCANALERDFAEAHWNKSLCLLLSGRVEEGWRLYEWRQKRETPVAPRAFPQARWNGKDDLRGKTLLVHSEQGLGDTIHFCRYAKLAEDRGAKVYLSVPQVLKRLVSTLSPTIEVVDIETEPRDFDFHIALLSMPLAFGTTLDNIPAQIPYLRAEQAKVRDWRDRIGTDGFKIGICWQGGKGGAIDIGRSFALWHFEGLSRLAGVRLISLQKNAGVEQLRDLPPGMVIETLGDDFDAGSDAFLDTAAAMENLDLVIASDTGIAHLAGALGRPVWVALKHVPEWRWLLDRTDSPWYPTMRLFRQTSPRNWQDVFARMEAQLATRTEGRKVLAAPLVPVSWGELIDKLTILEIKSERIANKAAHANVASELSTVRELAEPVLAADGRVANLRTRLRAINDELWRIEDDIRAKEAASEFDRDFIELARAVYLRNDERAAVKREIDFALDSELMEEKSYTRYLPEKDNA